MEGKIAAKHFENLELEQLLLDSDSVSSVSLYEKMTVACALVRSVKVNNHENMYRLRMYLTLQ